MTPSYALHIARVGGGEGLFPVKQAGLRACAGSPASPAAAKRASAPRAPIEDAYGARVYEVMGIGDVAASLWGECAEQSGMHFSEPDGIVVT